MNTPSGVTQFYTEPADGIHNNSNPYPAVGGVMWEDYRITITAPLGQKEEYYFDGYHSRSWHRDKNHYVAGEVGTVKTLYDFTLVDGRGEISRIDHQGGGTTYFNSYTSGGNPGSIETPDGRTGTYTYNARGKVVTFKDDNGTSSEDILHSYTYAANGLDLVEVTRTIGTGSAVVLGQWEHHPTTRDIVAFIDRAGLRTEYTRNALGQLTSVLNPRGDMTTLHYDAKGWLEEVRFQPAGGGTPITLHAAVVDEMGRTIAASDRDGHTLLHEYDDLNRVVKTIWPDATFTFNDYSCCTLSSTTARDGKVTSYTYDALKRLIQQTSPGGKTIHYSYDAVGNLLELASGRGETVQWEYDTANRPTKRINQDGTQLTYGYHSSNGRLIWSKDAQNRQTSYSYTAVGLLASVTHPSLPTQSYTYNALGQRLTWSDGSQVTTYAYDALDRLAAIDGPLSNDTIAYSYDQWHRLASWSYDGASESYTYDALDRIATITNPLGTFTHAYAGNSHRLASVAYPLTGLGTTYTYQPASQDFRLASIEHEGPGGTSLAEFGYTYTVTGEIATWSRTQPGLTQGSQWAMSYDGDGQLLDILETALGGSTPTPQRLWRQQYDASGNRTSYQTPQRTQTGSYNPRNQITSLTGGGTTVFRGQVNEPAQVTLDGKPARVYADGTFEASLNLGPGTHQVTLEATDQAANTTTETWQVDNGPATRTLSYDTDGNTLSDGVRTYTWDGRNRLTGIVKGGDTWSFSYNGANLRTAESKNGQWERQWVWHGTEVVEERLAGGGKRRYWSHGVEELDAQGQQTGKRYLLRDHLGSTRVVLDGSGVVLASYDCNPWGVRSKLTGSGEESVGYTGHWEHESGLVMAPYRVYDPDLGRWLSEDPLENAELIEGPNIYVYVDNAPLDFLDFDGRGKIGWFIRTLKGGWRQVSPSRARKAIGTGKDVMAKGCGASGKAKKLAKDTWGEKAVRHDPHSDGLMTHYQHKNGGKGHIFYDTTGFMIGLTPAGDVCDLINAFKDYIEWMIPLADPTPLDYPVFPMFGN